jgi:hypothetical protein
LLEVNTAKMPNAEILKAYFTGIRS